MVSTQVFIESDLLSMIRDAGGIDLVDDSHGYINCARRLFLTVWLLAGIATVEAEEAVRATTAFWNARKSSLHNWRRVTVTTLLFELESLGLVESFTAAPGGFKVTLREGAI